MNIRPSILKAQCLKAGYAELKLYFLWLPAQAGVQGGVWAPLRLRWRRIRLVKEAAQVP